MAHLAGESGEATTPPRYEHSKNANTPPPWRWIFLGAVLCWLLAGFLPFILYLLLIRNILFSDEELLAYIGQLGVSSREDLLEYTGQIGDTFGAANATFSAIALMFLAFTLVQQHRALSNQLADLELTRRELILTRQTSQDMAKIQKIIPLFSEYHSREIREAQSHLESLKARDAEKRHAECLVTPELKKQDFSFYGSVIQRIYFDLKHQQANGTLCEPDREYLLKLDNDIQIFYAFFYKIFLLLQGKYIDMEIAKTLIDPHTMELIRDIAIPLELSRTGRHTSPIHDIINGLYTREEIKESSNKTRFTYGQRSGADEVSR